MWYCLDTSAFVKRYRSEVGSDVVQRLFAEPTAVLFVSALTLAETYAALYRHSRKGRLPQSELTRTLDGVTADLERSQLHILDVTSQHVARSRTLIADYDLTSHDALILAAACELRPFEVIFVCADTRSGLLRAAEACGLSTLNPLSPA